MAAIDWDDDVISSPSSSTAPATPFPRLAVASLLGTHPVLLLDGADAAASRSNANTWAGTGTKGRAGTGRKPGTEEEEERNTAMKERLQAIRARIQHGTGDRAAEDDNATLAQQIKKTQADRAANPTGKFDLPGAAHVLTRLNQLNAAPTAANLATRNLLKQSAAFYAEDAERAQKQLLQA